LSFALAAAAGILVTIFAIHSTIEGYKERKAKQNTVKGISTVGLFRAFLGYESLAVLAFLQRGHAVAVRQHVGIY
jgi:hypothetical protein